MNQLLVVKIHKQGQITIFIILATVIVASILGIVLLYGGKEVKTPKEVNPEQFIKNCVKDVVKEKIQVMLDNGGRTSPTQVITYNGQEYTYLCYQADYYSSCYNLYPGLETSIEEELHDNTINHVQRCFDATKENFEDLGFTVTGQAKKYAINLASGQLKIILRYNITISDQETGRSYEEFDTTINTALFELIQHARNIINDEAEYCNYDDTLKALLYPNIEILRTDQEGSKLYTIRDRRTDETLRFAIRSCASGVYS